MGHVLLAAPTIERFHLHEQVGRRLMRRGHRVTLLTTDPVTHRCYETHGLPARLLAPGRIDDPSSLPVHDCAARDERLAAPGPPDLRRLRRLRTRLARRTAPLLRLFEVEIPDVVVTVQGRSGLHRLVDSVARSFGCAATHLGGGLLDGTMQRDPAGIDGDADVARRAAAFYRTVRADRPLCDASLAAALGDVDAPAVARRFVHPPDVFDHVASVAAARSRAAVRSTLDRLRTWREESARPYPRRSTHPVGLPTDPFVAVLLQGPRDQRVLLDTEHGGPQAVELARAVRRATHAIDPSLGVIAIRSPDLGEDVVDALRADGIRVLGADATATAAAIASAVVTVNLPLAMVAILAGTPLLHLGHAWWGVPGIAHATTVDRMRTDLEAALRGPSNATLRARFATRVLTEDHLWCDPDAPDPNGLRGVVSHIEAVLQAATPPPEPTPYRAGPGWPLVRGS